MRPRISVAVPVYNGMLTLGRAVESALGQSLPPTEVLVIDDGSSDNPASVLDRINSPLVRYVRTTRSGLARTRNKAIELCKGTHLAFLDADDILKPRFLRSVHQAIVDQDPDLVHTGYLLRKREGTIVRTSKLGTSDRRTAYRLLMTYGNYISISGSTAKVETLRNLGGFYEGLGVNCGCEDWDMWIRLTSKGTVAFLPEVMVEKEYNPEGPYKRLPAAYRSDMEKVVRRGLALESGLSSAIGRRALANLYYLWAAVEWERRDSLKASYFLLAGISRFPALPIWLASRQRIRSLLEQGAA